jgi:hypothetical protein
MKKTISFAGLIVGVLLLASCKKEEETKKCNCGTIANDGISTNADGSSCYWLEIRNSCSGNKKTWCFDQDVWMNAAVGSDFCVTNETSW